MLVSRTPARIVRRVAKKSMDRSITLECPVKPQSPGSYAIGLAASRAKLEQRHILGRLMLAV